MLPPNPDSQEIKQTTVELCMSYMRDQLIQEIAPRILKMPQQTLAMCGYPELKYDAWVKLYEEPVHGEKLDNPINNVVNAVDEAIDLSEFTLENIRITQKDYSAKRTDFMATLTMKDGSYFNVIAYAQYTTDGKIWVSVTSIEPASSI